MQELTSLSLSLSLFLPATAPAPILITAAAPGWKENSRQVRFGPVLQERGRRTPAYLNQNCNLLSSDLRGTFVFFTPPAHNLLPCNGALKGCCNGEERFLTIFIANCETTVVFGKRLNQIRSCRFVNQSHFLDLNVASRSNIPPMCAGCYSATKGIVTIFADVLL